MCDHNHKLQAAQRNERRAGEGVAVRTLTQKDFQFVKYYQEVEVKRAQTFLGTLGTSACVLERESRERGI